MKIYFAGAENKTSFSILEKLPVDILVSYYYLKNRKINFGTKNIFLDSGGFSAFTKNKIINIDEYISFIKNSKGLFKYYANLDVISDPVKSQINQEYIEKNNLQPLPTFHFGSDIKYLYYICENYDYFCLGGLVPLALKRNKMINWLNKCFSIIGKYWPKKVHGFGVNSFYLWNKYPFYSVDATSWIKWSAFKRLIKFDYSLKKMIVEKKQDKNYSSFLLYEKDNNYIAKHNCLAFLEASEFTTKLWNMRGIKWIE